MDDFVREQLNPHGVGILFALFSMVYGFVVGGLMGYLDSDAKDMLRQRANRVLDSVYGGDEEKREKVVSKGWKYCIRAHIHGGAIGTSALVACILLALLGEPGLIERVSSFSFGVGALVYSIYWMMAGIRTVDMGVPKQAKESLRLVAIPGAGLALIGLFGTVLSVMIRVF